MDGRFLGMGAPEVIMVLILHLLQALPWILLVVLAILAIRWFLRQERERKDPERMAVRHTAEDPTLWPDSRANADNYYVRNGYTAVEASVAAAAAAVRSQWDDGRAVLEFRCETPEVYAGMRSLLFDRDRLWDVYRALGSYVPSSGYQCADDQQIVRLIPTR